MSSLIQYVVIRSDLIKDMKWPIGAVIAQACHACTAVIHLFYNDEHTQTYLSNIDNMHKVVLEVPDEDTLKKVHELLSNNNVYHKLWMEQPENIPTCLAVKPYPKNEIHKYMKNLKLYRT